MPLNAVESAGDRFGRMRGEGQRGNESVATALETPAGDPWFGDGRGVLACIGLALAAVWMLYRLRLRQLACHARDKMQERLVERERIARDLHDTLLQGIQGLILTFQSASDQLPATHPLRPRMAQALERADRVLAEGRERVLGLRLAAKPDSGLAALLQQTGAELSRDHGPEFRLSTDGPAVSLPPALQRQVNDIVTEALLNAFRHAAAQRIDLALKYSPRALSVHLSDDGKGMAEALLRHGKPGHWGLAGMRERAFAIGADLEFRSQAGRGTHIRLELPLRCPGAAHRIPCGARIWQRLANERMKEHA